MGNEERNIYKKKLLLLNETVRIPFSIAQISSRHISKFRLGLSEFGEVYLSEKCLSCSFNGITNETVIFRHPVKYV